MTGFSVDWDTGQYRVRRRSTTTPAASRCSGWSSRERDARAAARRRPRLRRLPRAPPATARHIADEAVARFVSDDAASRALVDALAETSTSTNDTAIAPVLRRCSLERVRASRSAQKVAPADGGHRRDRPDPRHRPDATRDRRDARRSTGCCEGPRATPRWLGAARTATRTSPTPGARRAGSLARWNTHMSLAAHWWPDAAARAGRCARCCRAAARDVRRARRRPREAAGVPLKPPTRTATRCSGSSGRSAGDPLDARRRRPSTGGCPTSSP